MPEPRSDITNLLAEIDPQMGWQDARWERIYERAFPLLRRVAANAMARERADHTLQPTALVNEAYLRLAGQSATQWVNRNHFLAVAARVMRRVLVDHARSNQRIKRGADWTRVTFSALEDFGTAPELIDILTLDASLDELKKLDERSAIVAEKRIFGGMTNEEIAQTLSVSARTIYLDWEFASRWLTRRLTSSEGNAS